MDLEISWTANWIGNYNVCYREAGTLNYTCSIEFVAALGPATKTITVPNNYCDLVVYEGYILAECQGNADPAEGTQFTIQIVQKDDPCNPYNVHCDNAPIASLIPSAPGIDYVTGEDVLADGIPVGTIVAPTGFITDVIITDSVTTFTTPPVVTISTTSGTGGAIQLTLADCQPILQGCDGTNDQGVPVSSITPSIPIGSDFYLCATAEPEPTPAAQYTVTALAGTPSYETCHCEQCIEVTVSNPTGTNLSIWYTTYDSGLGSIVLWKEVIVAGASNQLLANQAISGSVTAQVGLVVVIENCPAIA